MKTNRKQRKKAKNEFLERIDKKGFLKDPPTIAQKIVKKGLHTAITVALLFSLYQNYIGPSANNFPTQYPHLQDSIIGENPNAVRNEDNIKENTETTENKIAILNLLKSKIKTDISLVGGKAVDISQIKSIYNIPYVYEEFEEKVGQLDIIFVDSKNKTYCMTYDNSSIETEIKKDENAVNYIGSFVNYLQLCGPKKLTEMTEIQSLISDNITGSLFVGDYYLYTQKGGIVNYNIPIYYLDNKEVKVNIFSATKNSLDNYDLNPYTTLLEEIKVNKLINFKEEKLSDTNGLIDLTKTINNTESLSAQSITQ